MKLKGKIHQDDQGQNGKRTRKEGRKETRTKEN
jgi:hypothetical protein